MSLVNTSAKELHFKLVYCGPEGAGKKSALHYIKDSFQESKSDILSFPVKKELVYLELCLGKLLGFQVFFHITALNHESKADNQTLLKNSDGLLFMASFSPKDRSKNKKALAELEEYFEEQGESLLSKALVFQYNKRDLKKKTSLLDMRLDLNKYNKKEFESSAKEGDQVLEALKFLCKLLLRKVRLGF